ncbi:uncharacterized protein BYT42DRAFT_562072 [Radiomyces spectabilis]|uniref:uncharacterized protein n=1 Tax=Radiomyces spectabilis TaxID=64574 RepID=UPI002220E826|nr:uncharacterized protein BYT42DRAFT_562072 [Radiomyces spectabilis]KAI8384307.1 hypothetical protein BYT42DRAFT_562072 [Radiomyces spectabilis]
MRNTMIHIVTPAKSLNNGESVHDFLRGAWWKSVCRSATPTVPQPVNTSNTSNATPLTPTNTSQPVRPTMYLSSPSSSSSSWTSTHSHNAFPRLFDTWLRRSPIDIMKQNSVELGDTFVLTLSSSSESMQPVLCCAPAEPSIAIPIDLSTKNSDAKHEQSVITQSNNAITKVEAGEHYTMLEQVGDLLQSMPAETVLVTYDGGNVSLSLHHDDRTTITLPPSMVQLACLWTIHDQILLQFPVILVFPELPLLSIDHHYFGNDRLLCSLPEQTTFTTTDDVVNEETKEIVESESCIATSEHHPEPLWKSQQNFIDVHTPIIAEDAAFLHYQEDTEEDSEIDSYYDELSDEDSTSASLLNLIHEALSYIDSNHGAYSDELNSLVPRMVNYMVAGSSM